MLGEVATSQVSREPGLELSFLTDARGRSGGVWQKGPDARLSFMLAFCDMKLLEKKKKKLNPSTLFLNLNFY